MRTEGLDASKSITFRILRKDDTEAGPDSIDLKPPGVSGYVIGRADEALQYEPDIDLTRFDGIDMGVSRRHAALVRYKDVVHIIDLKSMNGTFVNGERLVPDNPHPLSDGDKVGIANLNFVVSQ